MSFNIQNRRYTGSKFKIAEWIMELILKNCKGESFADIFAGTGIIAEHAMKHFQTITINDILFSNNIIYKGFFEQVTYSSKKIEEVSKFYSSIYANNIGENYFSNNFGNKFFSRNDAKVIGFIREDLNSRKNNLSSKEFSILLASLLYSADRVANTVGHFDAYIKNKPLSDKFIFDNIAPIVSDNIFSLYREDANILVDSIESDIVYIDPPYNSRQYSRFYHLLENLTKWEKPELFGEALKPEPENMSDYCRVVASIKFFELVNKLNCKYIVVSYNNTYNSKSNSSRNKIEIDYIISTLSSIGKLSVFEKSYNFFNAGKTKFDDHKEFIFILKKGD